VKGPLKDCEDNYQSPDKRLSGIRLQVIDWVKISEAEVQEDRLREILA